MASKTGAAFSAIVKRASAGGTLLGGVGRVEAMALSPDGRLCAACHICSVTLWSVLPDKFEFRGSIAMAARAAAFSHDAVLLGLAGPREVELYRVSDLSPGGAPLRVASARSLAWSARGALAAAGKSGAVVLRGEKLKKLGNARATRVAFTPDGRRLVAGAEDGSVSVFDAETLKQLQTRSIFAESIAELALSSDGRFIGAAARFEPFGHHDDMGDENVHVLRSDSLETERIFRVGPGGIAFRPGTDQLAIVQGDHRDICVYEVRTGRRLFAFNAHGDTNSVEGLAFTSDGQRSVSASGQAGTLALVDVSTSDRPRVLSEIGGAWDLTGRFSLHAGGVVYETFDDATEDWALRGFDSALTEVPEAFAVGSECAIRSFGVLDPDVLAYLNDEQGLSIRRCTGGGESYEFFAGEATCVAAAGRQLAVGLKGPRIHLCLRESVLAVLDRNTTRLDYQELEFGAPQISKRGWRELAFMAESRLVAIDATGNSFAIFGTQPYELRVDTPATALAAVPDLIAIASKAGVVSLLEHDRKQFRRLARIELARKRGAVRLACDASGKLVAIGRGQFVALHDRDGRYQHGFEVDRPIAALAFTPGGQALLVGLEQGGLRCFDVTARRAPGTAGKSR